MVSQSPTLIVSCTDRKALAARSRLQVRTFDRGRTVDRAAEIWAERMTSALAGGDTRPLRDLYRGEYWSVASSLESHAHVWVASAGLGLAQLGAPGTGYGATFAPNVEDSITRFSAETDNPGLEWWDGLRRGGLGHRRWRSQMREVVLVAVSEPYQRALTADLLCLAKDGHKVVVMSGSPQIGSLRNVPDITHVETGQWLRMMLGGSTPCVGVRFAAHVLRTGAWRTPERVEEALSALYDSYRRRSAGKLPVFDREPRDDAQVKKWIRDNLRNSSIGRSKSAFLRELRAQGFACEQKRFGRLFDQVVKG